LPDAMAMGFPRPRSACLAGHALVWGDCNLASTAGLLDSGRHGNVDRSVERHWCLHRMSECEVVVCAISEHPEQSAGRSPIFEHLSLAVSSPQSDEQQALVSCRQADAAAQAAAKGPCAALASWSGSASAAARSVTQEIIDHLQRCATDGLPQLGRWILPPAVSSRNTGW